MRRRLALMVAAAAVSAVRAQSPAAPMATTTAPTGLRLMAPMVVLDVAVRDKDGHPVHGLKGQDFRLTEGGVVQTIRQVREQAGESPVVAAPAPEAPGVFTNYTPLAPDSTLNILLIDALNTPGKDKTAVKDRAFIREQLQEYVKDAPANTHLAIFGLANRLILLQGFTSDPAVLRGVVERKLIERRSSSLLPEGTDRAPGRVAAAGPAEGAGSPSAMEIAANLREFQSELGAMETQLRLPYTLDAFNTLAHYLAGLPGRKNLIWFAGSFPLPIHLDPGVASDPGVAQPADIAALDQAELRETVDLFSKARVAVYPVDARGLRAQAEIGGSTGSDAQARRAVAEANTSSQGEAGEHARMDELAESTGGRAFYDDEPLAEAVRSAAAAGADSYALGYMPTSGIQGGGYRRVRVEVVGVNAAGALQLSYRRGYSVGDASEDVKAERKPDALAPDPAVERAAAYKHAAMSRGGPTPEDVLFKVRVLPASAGVETAVAADNQLAPNVPAKGPFRRYDVDFIALAGEMAFTAESDGRRTAKAEFMAYLYDTEGRLLNATGKEMTLEATTTDVTKLAHGLLRCHLELSVPDRVETFLRIGIRDVTTNKFGVVEVPASSLSSLVPAAPTPAGAAGRTTPARD